MYCVHIVVSVNHFPAVITEGLVGVQNFLLKGNIFVSLFAELGSLECFRQGKVQEAYKVWPQQTLVRLLAPVESKTLRGLVSTTISS